jgi:hypothetical protein
LQEAAQRRRLLDVIRVSDLVPPLLAQTHRIRQGRVYQFVHLLHPSSFRIDGSNTDALSAVG